MATKEKYKAQSSKTENNKKKNKEKMTKLYVKAHGSENKMPNWDSKPDYTSKKDKIRRYKENKVIEFMIKGK